MNGVNLIPASRRRARRKSLRVRAWGAAAMVVTLGLCAAELVLWSMWSRPGPDHSAMLVHLEQQIETAREREQRARAEVREARALEAAAREVADQPDWGVLLALVGQQLGTEAVLDTCRLEAVARVEPAAKAGAKPAPAARPQAKPERFTLVLGGVAKSQDSASQVALGLKGTGLFEGVSLVETRRTPFMGGEAVSFRIECAIADAAGSNP